MMDVIGCLIGDKTEAERDTIIVIKKVFNYLNYKACFLKFLEISKNSLRDFIKLKPKVILYMPGTCSPVSPQLLGFFKEKLQAPIILISADDMDTYIANRHLLGYIDCVYTNSFLAKKLYAKQHKKVFFLVWGFSPEVYGAAFSDCRYKYDIGFLGSGSQYRRNYLHTIRQLACSNDNLRINIDFVGFEKMVSYYKKTKINLDISTNINKYRRRLNYRIWEVLGTGGFLLCEYVKGIERFFKIGEYLDCFNNKKELKYLINYYFHNDKIREEIRINGQKRVLKDYNLLKIWQNIINMHPIFLIILYLTSIK